MFVALERPYVVVATRVWQVDFSDNYKGFTTNISVWLHDWGQAKSSSLPAGNYRSFWTGVLCSERMWPEPGLDSQTQSALARCTQTIATPGATWVIFQKHNDFVKYPQGSQMSVAEVQIMYDGEGNPTCTKM